MRHPTIYVTKKDLQRAGVGLSTFPNAGPNPNITGMKNLYWGKDALCTKHGRYVYLVPAYIYNLFKEN